MGTGLRTQFQDASVSVPVGETHWSNKRSVRDDNYWSQQSWVPRRAFVLAQDVAQVFYIKDISSRPKKGINKQTDEPKRHIVLSGKRNIVRVEDKTDLSADYNNFVDIPPFAVNIDPSILLANEDAPYLRRDHNQGTFVKRKSITVAVAADP